MGFLSLTEIKKSNTHMRVANAGVKQCELTVSVAKGYLRKSDNVQTYALTFRIRNDLLEKARFLNGDIVDVLFDPDQGIGLIRRNNDGAMTLHAGKSEPNSCRISITLRSGMPAVKSTRACESVEVNNEGIMFTLPDEYFIYKEGDIL